MQENNEIKPYENNISEQKTKQYHERNSVNTKIWEYLALIYN